jgi:hypothetical protein
VISFRPMPDASTPQFNTAEYAGQPGTDRCHYCQRTIGTRYYRVNNRMACPACTEQAALAVPQQGHAAFMRALLFGAGAAIAGLALYATVEIVTGWIIAYVSLAVGWMVGKAMMAGSKGAGGRRYQIAAVLLTYAAVSMAIIPVILSRAVEHRKARHQQQIEQPAAPDGESQPAQPRSRPPVNFFAVLGQLAFIGLASPFLELRAGIHGVIGLIILSIGIQIAWRITAATPTAGIIGPFSTTPPASP